MATKNRIFDGKDEVLFGVTSDLKTINNTSSPDELASVAALLLNNAIITIKTYADRFPEEMGDEVGSYTAIEETIVKTANLYVLAEAGMTEEEMLEIVPDMKGITIVKRDEKS